MPDATVSAILNVSAPNSHILLERASQAIDKAFNSKAAVVFPDHVYAEPAEEVSLTKLEASILHELTACR